MENEYAKSIPPPGKVHLFCGVCFCSSLTLLKNLTNTYKNYISKLYITVCKTLQPVPNTRGVWQVFQYVWGARQLKDRARSVRQKDRTGIARQRRIARGTAKVINR